MNPEKVKDALVYLNEHPQCGPFCSCGHSRGHSLGHCHHCGQSFSTPASQITRGGLIQRLQRRPMRSLNTPERRARWMKDQVIVAWGYWVYARWKNWNDPTERDQYTLEDFTEAFKQYEATTQSSLEK